MISQDLMEEILTMSCDLESKSAQWWGLFRLIQKFVTQSSTQFRICPLQFELEKRLFNSRLKNEHNKQEPSSLDKMWLNEKVSQIYIFTRFNLIASMSFLPSRIIRVGMGEIFRDTSGKFNP